MNRLKHFFASLYLKQRTYLSLLLVIGFFLLSFFFPGLFEIAIGLFFLCCALVLVDILVLYLPGNAIQVERDIADRLSNGEENPVSLLVRSNYPLKMQLDVIDELPFQLQERNFNWKTSIDVNGTNTYNYLLRPVERGEYKFGYVNVYVNSFLGLVKRRFLTAGQRTVKVYPAFQQLKQLGFKGANNLLQDSGAHRHKVMGFSMEYDHIKEYVQGDDIRALNYKASARRGHLMVNSYTEEKSQQVYCVIDKSRNMRMPFNGLTLLDYAINASLIFSNTAINKGDKAGLITFSDQQPEWLKASNRKVQMNAILEKLYAQGTTWLESDYEKLVSGLRKNISQRSLLILFTNFESVSNLQRQIAYLRTLAKYHLLMVVFFENTELKSVSERPAENIEGIYTQVIAQKMMHDKKLIQKELAKYGILSLLTAPASLTVNLINRYLDLKQRRVI